VAAGNWPEEGSLERSEAEMQALLPGGLATPDTWLWSAQDASDAIVGDLWVARHPTVANAVYIYDIDVVPEARGRGVGRGILDRLEAWARDAGVERIALHVFADNDVARRLYQRSGYVETNVLMEKRSDWRPPLASRAPSMAA
jgi:GNAT superfamily N-acetyltransferase